MILNKKCIKNGKIGIFNMTKKRFTIKQQDDYFGVVDNNTDDKSCVVNGIRTEIEAEWLCDSMNKLNDENEQLKFDMKDCAKRWKRLFNKYIKLQKENKELKKENEQLKAQLYCDSDEGVCIICKYHYLEKGKTYEKYYISKCKKGHEQCSKMDLKYCEDFELKEGDV